MKRLIRRSLAVMALSLPGALSPALAQSNPPPCQKDMAFGPWLEHFLQEARQRGVNDATIAASRPHLVLDPSILPRDTAQGVFQQSFLQFSGRMISQGRIQKGTRLVQTHRELFQRIERDFGVPAEVLVAFWALETDFSSNLGNRSTLGALTTLAYDCRRSSLFRFELLSALKIVQRGDLSPAEMRGAWAGELGGLMMSASNYLQHGLDYDGDGRRDLLHSVADTMGTAAKLLVNRGWKRGEPWLREVRLPKQMPWEEGDLSIQHPQREWLQWGVRAAKGELPADDTPASLLMPMGHLGPAFLAYGNFKAYLGWNSSLIYAITAAHLAGRIAGEPAVGRGNGVVNPLSIAQVKEIQELLIRRGEDVGTADGKMGAKTRAAIRRAQLRLGLPADSYPTLELLERLRSGR
ncbi:MAG: lytic murein transglycosylase [Bdellovibrionaceae bacterium]|nr:lytic murein transglycosylase [Pseudobdellovibrionaceae bacterium]